jgi:polar amino acid transport system substrate-binding protein
MRNLVAAVCLPGLTILALAGCGSSSNTTNSTSVTVVKPAVAAKSATVASQVPAAMKSKGTLNVATEAQYAPNEFIAPNGHAIGATMGLKVNLINSNFETIIPGLAAGRYDVGASSFTDTKEREKTVDFVDYFNAGISFYGKSSANTGVTTLADLCGKTVAVEKGTVEQEGAEAQSKMCKSENKKPVSVLVFTGQNAVNLAVSDGRAEVGMADSPVVAYQIKQSDGAFKLVGKTYNFAPYGLAIPKTSGMTTPILAALKVLIANGEYHAILAKWGLEEGAITEPTINGAKS